MPTPTTLFAKIKNTSAIALRAAYLHGPYTLYASCHPASFDPWSKHDGAGQPQFEPNLKAGGSWNAKLAVPEDMRETSPGTGRPGSRDGIQPSVTWILEVASQVLFSPNATVHYEIVVGRDEKSIDLGFAGLVGGAASLPAQLADHQNGAQRRNQKGTQPKGVFSKAIQIVVEDTADLWNKPALPSSVKEKDTISKETGKRDQQDEFAKNPSNNLSDALHRAPASSSQRRKKRKRVHLVILTHGLHSNLGADMLYLKESIDAAAKRAALDRKMNKAQTRRKESINEPPGTKSSGSHGSKPEAERGASGNAIQEQEHREEEPDEDIIVRGYSGNVARTERGIQYLGKRLAKYVLSFTYPDQPYFPTKKSVGKSISKALGSPDPRAPVDHPTHAGSSVKKDEEATSNSPYQVTSISFIGHSLGGLVQTYAIAYIKKHSPDFFERIKPINFVTLATPFLGLSNENPIYVKFALNFGVVGRTGQDLGLTWRAPTIARSGWGAMIAGLGAENQRKQGEPNPGAKPLLRILPSGPAHQVLRLFRNRTVYSNVVNDGVVPLRTSCLLFLDWRGLGRVEKARRENGLVGAMADWGWNEITGTNATEQQKFFGRNFFSGDLFSNENSSDEEGTSTPNSKAKQQRVPQPANNATQDDSSAAKSESPEPHQFLNGNAKRFEDEEYDAERSKAVPPSSRPQSPLAGLINFFKPSGAGKTHHHPPKQHKIYQRGQTIKVRSNDGGSERTVTVQPPDDPQPGMARGDEDESVYAPPKTTIFESAGDILNPPIPSMEYLTDPSSRPRTIFHDRVYHPDDIPAPPTKRTRTGMRRNKSSDGQESRPSRSSTVSTHETEYESSFSPQTTATPNAPESGSIKVEEKIARAYHRDLSWRKVLVRLEPDAHNNIVVRRMFANAYGWPVIRHLVDTHFGDTFAALTADAKEPNTERARPMDQSVDSKGKEIVDKPKPRSSSAEPTTPRSEKDDGIGALLSPRESGKASKSAPRPTMSRIDSAAWDDRFFETDDEDDDHDDFESPRSPPPSDHRIRDESREGPSIGARRGKDQPHVNIVKPIVAPTLVQSPGGSGTMGLRKSLEEQMDSGQDKADATKHQSSGEEAERKPKSGGQ